MLDVSDRKAIPPRWSHDAIDVFRATVDRLLDRMVYVNYEIDLLDAPDGVARGRLNPGTVLLREKQEGSWSFVRVPSDTTAGWVPDEQLRPVSATTDD